MFNSIYSGKRVFVTGHTGFKGSWLSSWLDVLGASVTGYSLEPPTEPNHFDCLALDMVSRIADVRSIEELKFAINEAQPEIIFHLAAQPSVLVSYDDPLETFSTNVMGVANILEAARGISSVRAVVVVTTDKCYENMEIEHSYKESDRLGGHDPYSASKACAELVTACFRRSYSADSATLIASARAGNVVGGGDWTADRLIPDAVRSASAGKNMVLRSPNSARPWQHVLEPLSGYLSLGQRLLEGESELAGAWNFGPKPDSNLTTREVLALAQSYWPAIRSEEVPQPNAPHEAGLLMVDSSKANQLLEWFPVWDLDSTLKKTIEWYRHYYSTHREILTALQIEEYCIDANEAGAIWAKN